MLFRLIDDHFPPSLISLLSQELCHHFTLMDSCHRLLRERWPLFSIVVLLLFLVVLIDSFHIGLELSNLFEHLLFGLLV